MNLNINLLLAIISTVVSFYIIYKVKNKSAKFSLSTLAALILGLAVGAMFKENTAFLQVIGKGYMGFLKMTIVPLVSLSIITSTVRLKNIKTIKTIGFKSVAVLLGTTGIASAIGIFIAKSFNLGENIALTAVENFKPREIPTLSKVILDMIPSNPVASIVDNKIIPIVIFSLFIAIALVIEDNRKPERVKAFKEFVLSAYSVVLRITKIILKFIPYGVFSLIATVAATNGIDTIKSLIVVIGAVYLAVIIQIAGVHTSLIAFVARRNPIEFFKAILPAQTMAFSSQSSYGTLPVTIKSLVENAKVSENIASFVASLGSTVGMNGCGGLYPAIVAIFVANVYNVNLTGYHYLLIILTTIVSSIGIAGVPGAATMSTTVVLATLGLPLEGMALVMAVDTIIDMIRTTTNVTGASVAAVVVYESEKRKELNYDKKVIA
ncbi:dicarboxylate/amino acid:cation symporter [Clostridium carnis]